MTAIFMACLPGSIVAAADGAFYGQDGRLTTIASKFTLLPEHDCVITLQGPFFYHAELRANLISNGGGFDCILHAIPRVVRGIYDRYQNAYGYSRAFDMLIGGYSEERQCWESYWLHSEPWKEGSNHEPYEPWQLVRAFRAAWVPGYGREACAAAGMDPDTRLTEQGMGAYEIAVRVICAARAQPIPIKDDPLRGTCQVGGFIQLVEMTRNTVTSSIAHRWPDMVGFRLSPEHGQLVPEFVEPETANVR